MSLARVGMSGIVASKCTTSLYLLVRLYSLSSPSPCSSQLYVEGKRRASVAPPMAMPAIDAEPASCRQLPPAAATSSFQEPS